jgi:hypothetical protein
MPTRPRNGVLLMVAALASTLVLAACGGASPSQAKGASGRAGVFIAFSKCMRAHGVTNFPDPSGSGGGINLSGTGINPRSPAFNSAQTVCFKLLPGGGPNRQTASAAQIRQADATARCMREHGVTGFPDPIISNKPPTSLNPSEYGSIVAGGGMIIAIPRSIDEQSPAFENAAKACKFGR